MQEVVSTDDQLGHADDIHVLSSELIVLEDGAEDDGARTGLRLAKSKVHQTVGTVASLGTKVLF